MPDPTDLIATYPRRRPSLSEAHRAIFEAEYKLNRNGDRFVEGLAKKLEGWMHRRVAREAGSPILEVGAGTLNHLRWERDLSGYDVVEPFTSLFADSPNLYCVRDVYAHVDNIPPGVDYARIISIAVLEHMEDLPAELAACGRRLRPGGVFQAGIPSEGGLLWWLGWRGTTGISYWLRNRLDYGPVIRHEHLNDAPEILALVRYFFEDVRVERFPLPLHHASFYAYVEARTPRLDRIAAFTRRRSRPGVPSS